jgi:hypothetical protein
MMVRKWTDEEVQAEIKAAVAIVNEDRERATYQTLHERFGTNNDPGNDSGNGGPPAPPKKDADADPEPTAPKKGLWWGDVEE